MYNLDKLAARSDARGVICKGEKSADAAARVIPDSVCVTSPNGSQSASKADWSPLHGRRVLIWPDADEQGSTYVAEVAAILHPLDCQVSIIDASALASIDPNGDLRPLSSQRALSHYRKFDAGNFASLKSRRGDGFVPCLHRRGPKGSVRFA